MKQFVLFVFLFGAIFAGAFAAARLLDMKGKKGAQLSSSSRFQAAPFALKNRPFTIVVTGRNNGASIAKTIASVFSQNYDNYRVIYIDDASDDGSFELARDVIYDSSKLQQATVARNEQRMGDLANLFRAVQTCQDDEIVVVLGGEDWLAHEWVLQRLNAYYADPNLWLAFGQYREFPSYQLGSCVSTYARKELISHPHLKSFYAGLFKKIRESDLVSGGKFLPACGDLAYMAPMLEMGEGHSHFISEVLYIKNSYATTKEDPELQVRCEKFVRGLDSYPTIAALQVYSCGE